MRVQTEEWRKFIPGIRMYKGKKTYFYNGEILYDDEEREPLIYSWEERQTWQVVIVLPGVEIIPEWTFCNCAKIYKVIMADTVKRIEWRAFEECWSLKFVKLSRNLEYIGGWAFYACYSLPSIFIPPSCTEIEDGAFCDCKLLILGLPQNVQLGESAFENTALLEASPFETDARGDYENNNEEEVVQWIRSINDEEAYTLHRACASYNPLSEIVYALVKRQGIKAMRMKNPIGITPSQYLAANTFADISEKEIINRYISEMMGDV